jgi:hypothetical protein
MKERQTYILNKRINHKGMVLDLAFYDLVSDPPFAFLQVHNNHENQANKGV